jgi:hypothetical protein
MITLYWYWLCRCAPFNWSSSKWQRNRAVQAYPFSFDERHWKWLMSPNLLLWSCIFALPSVCLCLYVCVEKPQSSVIVRLKSFPTPSLNQYQTRANRWLQPSWSLRDIPFSWVLRSGLALVPTSSHTVLEKTTTYKCMHTHKHTLKQTHTIPPSLFPPSLYTSEIIPPHVHTLVPCHEDIWTTFWDATFVK